MRQIKFRGRKFDGTIVYGDFVHTVPMSSFPGVVDFEGFVHEVAPESVAQLIAVDKNGREVYEGDTLKRFDELDADDTLSATFEDYGDILNGILILAEAQS